MRAFLFSLALCLIVFTVAAGDPSDPAVAPPVADNHPKDDGEHHENSRDDHHGSGLSEEVIPLRFDLVPNRPKPLLELGEPFLGSGTLSPGFTLPTGAVWQPSLLVFGTLRTALQSNGYDRALGDVRTTEAAARLDLFANLQLSGSERLVLGFRNLDQDGRFSGHIFDTENPGLREGGQDQFNGEVGTLFFEGDIGEIFPNLSPRDFKPTDIGFSIGRQPLFFQEGLLVNDTIDGVGLTWNSLQPKNTSNFRTTFFYGWNNVHRNNLTTDTGSLYALFTSVDFRKSTVDIDLGYNGGGDEAAGNNLALGISAVQRFGRLNTSFRVLTSRVKEADLVTDGILYFSELSWTPNHTHNLAYFNAFYADDSYTPLAQGPTNGGPLGRAGINFAGVGLGNYGSPLDAGAVNVYGGALGYQFFFNNNRRQLIVEVAGRIGTVTEVDDQYGFTARYQAALGRRFVIVVDAFANQLAAFGNSVFYGGRLEFQVRF